jgi:hypothetical protein
LLALRGRCLAWEAQETWLLAHLHLARLYQARGDAVLAGQILDSLLALWSSADADLPAAIEARRLHAALDRSAVAAR